jgi:mycothiol system anti-sigma-R factor
MNPCENFESHLLLYLDNALHPQEAENLRAHLHTCENCRARLEEEQELSRLLKGSRPLYSAPQQLRARVSAIERESASIPARRNWWHGGPWTSTWKVLVPATLALAIALALVPDVAQKVRASSYVETAVANHAGYLNGTVRPAFCLALQNRSLPGLPVRSRFNSGFQFPVGLQIRGLSIA